MDRELKFQRWPSSGQKWPRTTVGASATLTLYREKVRGWSMKNRSKCNFFRYSGQSNPRPTYGQRSFWPIMSVLTSKMNEKSWLRDGSPNIISRKGKGVVHEKSVKRQLLQIVLQMKPRNFIWIESLSSKDDRPQVKNGREQLWALQQP